MDNVPISPFTPIQIIQTEIHNWVTPRDEEDRLHSELRGEEHEFVIERDGEPQEAVLSIENIGVRNENMVKIGLRLQNYDCPTTIEDWEEDIIYLYIATFLRGRGSAEERGNPLLSDIEISGFNRHDIRISMFVYTTYQSGIWDAISRIAMIINLYHSDHFQYTKELFEEMGDKYREDEEAIHLGHGAELARNSDHRNDFQAYGYITSYFGFKINEQENDNEVSL